MPNDIAVPDWRRPALVGYAVIALAFGGVGGWAATAKLASGIVAGGVVSVESNRKTVQHLEGGIVSKILVKEGDRVEAGQLLFRLEPIQPNSNEQMFRGQLGEGRVLEARLIAERDQKSDIAFPADLLAQKEDPLIAHAIKDQLAQFQDRRRALNSQISVLEAKIQQIRDGIRGTTVDRQATQDQLGLVEKELAGVQQLQAKGLVPLPRVLSLQREKARLEGQSGRSITDEAKAENTIQETRLQIQQIHNKFQDEVGAALVEVRHKIAEAQEKLTIAQDVLRRVDIRAPCTGTAQNLKVFTVGQVIKPAEALLEIVPASDHLVVQARFSPDNIDGVYVGQSAEIRFPAFHDRTIPVIEGALESVSHDRLVDETTKQPYFLGLVAVSRTDIPAALNQRLRAGMPAEVIVSTGEQTMLGYLVSPLSEAMRRSLTER